MTNENLKIKAYDNWDLYLHEKQYPYIGSCYTISKNTKNILNMNLAERIELFDLILPEWNDIIKDLFHHNFVNILSNGNSIQPLKYHLIPMYESIRTFYGINFMPPNISGEYVSNGRKEIKNEILLEIRNIIKNKLEIR